MTATPNRKIERIDTLQERDRNLQNALTQKYQNSMPSDDHTQQQKDWIPKPDPLIETIIEGYTDAPPGQPGSKVKFYIKNLIGKGGMGVVYGIVDLTDPQVGHERALKLLSHEASYDQSTVDRFKQEIKATGKIDHPNVIKILAQGTLADGRHFILMPLLEGQSLSTLLKVRKEFPMSAQEMLGIFIQMCDGLAAAHKVKVFHRDVKPGNTMILPGRTLLQHKVVIVDFGIAKLVPHGDDGTQKAITTTGVPFGTPSYMSPEQCQGQTILDGRSDVYSMGCVMYEALTGSPPFQGEIVKTLYAHLHTEPDEIEQVSGMNKSTVSLLNSIVLKALRKDPSERYQSIEELSAALKTAEAEAEAPVGLVKEVKADVGAKSRKVSKVVSKNIRDHIFAISLAMVAVVTISAGAFVATPYVVTKDPIGSEIDIAWEEVNPLPARTPEAFAIKKRQIFGAYKEEALGSKTEKGIPITPDAFTIMKEGGDLFYKNQRFKEAANLYTGAVDVGNFLVLNGIETQVSSVAAASLCYAFCNLKLHEYKKAIKVSEDALQLKKSNLRVVDQALFYGIQAVANAELRARNERERREQLKAIEGNAAMCITYLKQSDFRAEDSYDVAPLLSRIGDFYLSSKQLDKAVETYEMAKKAWHALDERGKYNEGVADARLGLIAREQAKDMQGLQSAADLFEKAFALFSSQGEVNLTARARTKFSEANAYWQMNTWNGFWKAISVRKEAVDLWSELKKR